MGCDRYYLFGGGRNIHHRFRQAIVGEFGTALLGQLGIEWPSGVSSAGATVDERDRPHSLCDHRRASRLEADKKGMLGVIRVVDLAENAGGIAACGSGREVYDVAGV